MSNIRQLPAVTERVETGPIQFGDDWPGVFIRGDNASYFAFVLERYLDATKDVPDAEINRHVLQGLVSELKSSHLQ